MKRYQIKIDAGRFVPFLMRVFALVLALVGAFFWVLPDKWRLFFALWGAFEMFGAEFVELIGKR